MLSAVIRSTLGYPAFTVGTITSTPVLPGPLVGLAVKLSSAFALKDQSSSGPRKPLHASVTFWKSYAP
ncbi:hypothetical protein PVK06_020189 [Gossypium arboreum]|uniref:Uncharacterized protein n=1 Tax=Gossypium arboreum TaxID=29729 RepID=A0ABR0PLQ9_GOSAR|nr:hypothetical protein PVK06_020189 [Gossypium arboreum]